jgi:chemotaxis protein MotB
VVTAAVGLALLTSAGCASLEDLNKAKAAAARAEEELTRTSALLQEVRQQNQKLRDEIADLNTQLANRDNVIRNLEAANTDWADKFRKLEDLYKKAVGREAPLVGPILPAKLDAALRQFAKDNSDLVEYLPEYGMVKLKADLTFDVGSTEIKPGAGAALKKLAEILNTAEALAFNIYAAGHTDDIPLGKRETIEKHGSNWGLSVHRALAVVKSLFEAGVDQPRMAAMGFSMYHPVVANAPVRKGNPANRRVELWVVPPDKFLTLSSQAVPKPEG